MLSDALDAVVIPTKTKTHTKEAYGWEDVQDLIELALRCKSRIWHIIAPQQMLLSHMPKNTLRTSRKCVKNVR